MTDPRPVQSLALSSIREPAHRLRESIDAQKLGDLADDIAANGLHQAIGVRGPLDAGTYEIIYGHRRYLACQLLQAERIDARIYPPTFDPLQAAVAENEQRENLTPWEQALIVERFIARGEPEAAIARYLRRSPQWVHDRRAMLDWPPELQQAVHQGDLTLAVARTLRDIDHQDYRTNLISEATRTGATAAVVEVWRAHYLADRDRIITNHLAVEDIAQRREAWKIMVPCELCGDDHDYPDTRSLRICFDCLAEVERLIQAAIRDHGQPA